MIKVGITYLDGSYEEFKAENMEYSNGWVTLTIIDDGTKLQTFSFPQTSVRKIEEVEYCE